MYKLLFDIYGRIPISSDTKGAIINNTLSLMRFVLRKCQAILMRVLTRKKPNTVESNIDIVVSLTSFPKRLNTLWLTIESLKRQTVLPSKIVLYLINEEVSKENLPQSLLKEIDNIFEIRFRSGKLRAHGKYHFAMNDFPESYIITVDDDMMYPYDTIEALWNAHVQYPQCVITNNTHQISSENGLIKPYAEWLNIFKSSAPVDMLGLIPMGVGGALYPPHSLYRDTLNFNLAKELSYYADDLWLYAMTRLANRRVVKSSFNFLRVIPIDISDNVSLTSINNGDNQNDVQFNNIRNYYLEEIGVDIAK